MTACTPSFCFVMSGRHLNIFKREIVVFMTFQPNESADFSNVEKKKKSIQEGQAEHPGAALFILATC